MYIIIYILFHIIIYIHICVYRLYTSMYILAYIHIYVYVLYKTSIIIWIFITYGLNCVFMSSILGFYTCLNVFLICCSGERKTSTRI